MVPWSLSLKVLPCTWIEKVEPIPGCGPDFASLKQMWISKGVCFQFVSFLRHDPCYFVAQAAI